MGRDWIPPDDQGELSAILNLPEGTSLDATVRVSTELAEQDRQAGGVEFVNPYVHEGAVMSHSHIYIKLVDIGKRSFSNLDVAAEIRKICAAIPNLRYKVMIPSALGGGENFFPIRAIILGPDFDKVVALAKEAAARVRQIDGLTDVDASVSLNSPELQVKIDRQRASDLGVRAADVGNAVRLMIAGEDQITTYKEGDEQYDVTLQLLPEQQKNPEVLARLIIPSSKVGQVRLDNIASIERGRGAGAHRALQPAVPGADLRQQRARLPARRRRAGGGRGDPQGRAAPGLRLQVHGGGEDPRRDHAQPHHGLPAGVHLHVHGAGRAVRQLPAPVHDHAEPAAVDSRSRSSRCGSPDGP